MNLEDNFNFTGKNRRRWKYEFIRYLSSMNFTHALTLAWNRNVGLDIGRSHLRDLHGIIDRELLGPKFNKRPKEMRSFAVFVFEGLPPAGHLHVHSLWRIPQQRHSHFAGLFPGPRNGYWNRVVESGSCDLDMTWDPTVFAGYAMKTQHMGSEANEIVWSHDFLRP